MLTNFFRIKLPFELFQIQQVSYSDQRFTDLRKQSDQQLNNVQLLLDGERVIVAAEGRVGIHERLLSAIASNDVAQFKEIAEELGRRKISTESDWCQDDYLLFLLLLGKEKLGHPLPFLSKVIEVRRQNSNPVPQKINEVFAALERQEFGIDGEFGFLKIPLLKLIGKLNLGPADARKAIKAMSAPALLNKLSPFLTLLTIKAYDLVLFERQPLPTETTAQLLEGIEKHATDLSLRNWWYILTTLPARLLWGLIISLITLLGFTPFLIGIGKGLIETHYPSEVRSRPRTNAITGFHELDSDLPLEALVLARSLPQPTGAGKRTLLITVQAAPFETATPTFVVEASHPEKAIRNAFAFTQESSQRSKVFTVVPVQRDGGRFRAILPQQLKGQVLTFVLECEVDEKDDANTIGKGFVLRPLE